MSGLIDTHVHLDAYHEPAEIIRAANLQKVEQFVIPGIAPGNWNRLFAIAEQMPGVWVAPGVHPQAAGFWTSSVERQLRYFLEHPKTVAIGEVGLDKWVETPLPQQEEVLRKMIGLAREYHLPLLLHMRQSTGRLLTLIRQEGRNEINGIAHGFSGSLETAQQLIDLGFSLGIGSVITSPNAKRLPETARHVPADRLVLESDAPDMPLLPHRSSRKHPANLRLVAEALARIRNTSTADIILTTSRNARNLLNLPAHPSSS